MNALLVNFTNGIIIARVIILEITSTDVYPMVIKAFKICASISAHITEFANVAKTNEKENEDLNIRFSFVVISFIGKCAKGLFKYKSGYENFLAMLQ